MGSLTYFILGLENQLENQVEEAKKEGGVIESIKNLFRKSSTKSNNDDKTSNDLVRSSSKSSLKGPLSNRNSESKNVKPAQEKTTPLLHSESNNSLTASQHRLVNGIIQQGFDELNQQSEPSQDQQKSETPLEASSKNGSAKNLDHLTKQPSIKKNRSPLAKEYSYTNAKIEEPAAEPEKDVNGNASEAVHKVEAGIGFQHGDELDHIKGAPSAKASNSKSRKDLAKVLGLDDSTLGVARQKSFRGRASLGEKKAMREIVDADEEEAKLSTNVVAV